MNSKVGLSFQQVIEYVEMLPPEDQEILVELIKRRLIERRRAEIAHNAEETLRALREGKACRGTIEDLKDDLLREE